MTDQTTGHTRVALVTGATSGIGRAVALKLASDGFAVVVHGRDAERGAATVRAIEEAGGHARFASADLGNPDEVARLADDAGEVDVFVNNAGFSLWGASTGFRRRVVRRSRDGRAPAMWEARVLQ
jgi:NAD(P)-dependent dehydrogenase (short-subunit alcohol dehydrogenase family)